MDQSLRRLRALEAAVERFSRLATRLEHRQSEIIGVLVAAGLWPVDPTTGRDARPSSSRPVELPRGACECEPPCATLEAHEDRVAAALFVVPPPAAERAQRPCGFCGKWHPDEPPCERFAANETRQGRDANASGHPDHADGSAVRDGARKTPSKDPTVRKDPKRWRGESFVGRRFSETTSKYLEALASFLDWCADRAAAQHETTGGGAPRAPYILADAKLAREWALELGHREDAARGVSSRTERDERRFEDRGRE